MPIRVIEPMIRPVNVEYVISAYDRDLIRDIKSKLGRVPACRVLRFMCPGITLAETIDFVNKLE